eukprot:CAMPEP_0196739090 /NCGR_PEP_ID=MMETSP1091-20130531/19692_1 /TAXON_ID=302021 /ORGANISM="Rhodomonas sp., Strain CCMP768" /LENGTH=67 /DNA_ID=CAMNT_0042083359 /DNA_START=73 /DNA_END=272 /DNA_ORIENTATION=-
MGPTHNQSTNPVTTTRLRNQLPAAAAAAKPTPPPEKQQRAGWPRPSLSASDGAGLSDLDLAALVHEV